MKLYRYTSHWVILSYREVAVHFETYHVLKETDCGYWIGLYPRDSKHVEEDMKNPYIWKKWVSKNGRKRFAYPTKKEALESFIIRKRRQIGHAEKQKLFAERSLYKAEQIAKKEEFDEEETS